MSTNQSPKHKGGGGLGAMIHVHIRFVDIEVNLNLLWDVGKLTDVPTVTVEVRILKHPNENYDVSNVPRGTFRN